MNVRAAAYFARPQAAHVGEGRAKGAPVTPLMLHSMLHACLLQDEDDEEGGGGYTAAELAGMKVRGAWCMGGRHEGEAW